MGDLAEIRDNAARYRALRKFVEERVRQDQKWGEQNHSPEIWALILTEEVGEVAKAALPAYCGGEDITAFRKEVIQCGAVCLAILESLDRQRL
jgi:NTP pyrophosphatase (non-canonical NTP hydrolase)